MTNVFIAVILDTYVDNVEMEKRMQKLDCAWARCWARASCG